jgi:hypothetical protein
MIILAVGMPRAGSGWHYNIIHDLMVAHGAVPSQQIRKDYHLEKILTEKNCNIHVLSARRLAMASVPSLRGLTYCLKAHSAPTAPWRLLSRAGRMKTAFVYRDPRDAMLSAMDYGKRALEKGHSNAFSHLETFPKALEFMSYYLDVWEKWMKEKGILVTRYEDLLTKYDEETARLIKYFDICPCEKTVAVLEKYRPGKGREGSDGTHFFKGIIGRFRTAFNADEQKEAMSRFAPYLKMMDYPLE